MKTRCTAKQRKQSNSGSAIVTVLVVVTFITILATIMLYVSGSNFQMKVADYRTKESFYYAETPVEEFRAQLVEDVQDAFIKAYAGVISEYSTGKADAEDKYNRLFCKEMNEIWAQRYDYDADGNLKWKVGAIESVVQMPGEYDKWQLRVSVPTANMFEQVADKGWLIMRGVEFTYESEEGYTSRISTDFCITIPVVQWPDENGYYSAGEGGRLDFSSCVNYMNWTKE